MSQSGFLDTSGGTAGNIQTLTGNSGGSVPPSSNNINVVGDGTSVTVVGNPGTSTLTVSLVGGGLAMDSFQPDSGTNPVVPDANGLVRMAGSGSITTVGSLNTLTTQLTGLTNHSLQVGGAGTTLTQLGVATNGQLPIGSTGADPVLAALTAGTNVTITNGAGSITIAASGQIIPITFITDMSSPYTVLSADYFISVRTFNNPVTILLPNTTTTGRVIIIKCTDTTGVVSIPVTTVGGAVLIDGSTTYTMTVPLQAINLIWDGSAYEVY